MDGWNMAFELNLNLLVDLVEFLLRNIGTGVVFFLCFFTFALFLLVDFCFFLIGVWIGLIV